MSNSGFAPATVKVEGLKELRRTLKQAGGDLNDLKLANRHAAESIEPIAAGLAPKVTGRLVGTLRVGATQKAGLLRSGRKLVPYAGPIHWGWPARGIRPHPYMTEAATNNEHIWMQVYINEVDRAIKKVKGK
ncbi:HK97 gp10 family phage protein [Corynebacterium striatum]|uniref:HK97 gp10 family phage protein n=1 Tax=Corynebacterium striatum TaxID=43770 RepID=UPI001A258057|nr:HK97 gp10 family phage protein [Corynebacterium striatum]HAT1503351.1 HK97 gp10 family phage protein [Corynebacterium striatum]HAT1505928.1 HK97 gp10 family phage protein [Corynebacterium striatum]